MRGVTTAQSILYRHIAASDLASEITGTVRKGPQSRPLNSAKEDVVINSLPFTGEQVQKGVLNVNVYVPDLEILEEDGVNQVADNERLEVLETLALSVLNGIDIASNWRFSVQQSGLFKDPQSNSHYLNIRVDFYFINLN